jgi:3-dehydroquinate synthase
MAEIVKHAAIADAPMFDYLENCSADLLRRDAISLRQIVARNCQIKAEVVAADPHERGLRAVLNYGHTVGHAIEAAAGEWDLRHGEAVAYGMIVEARLAVSLGLAGREVPERLAAVLKAFNLAGPLPDVDVERARRALLHDKKIADGRLKLPLVPRLGEVLIREDIPATALWDALEVVIAH